MFGFDKEKTEVRSVEDYLRTDDGLTAGPDREPAKRRWIRVRLKPLIGPCLGLLFVAALVAAALSQFNGLRSEIAEVKSQKDGEIKELNQQVAELTARASQTEKQTAVLTENISMLERALDAERSARVMAEEAARRAAAALRAKKGLRRAQTAAARRAGTGASR